jgi:cytochrome c biogenesis protein CcdA
MLRLIGIVVSIGLADSLNPTTIAPALFLASRERPRDQVIRFTLGVFLVYFAGGAVIALGPGQLVLSLVPHPDHAVRHVLEIIAGVVMLVAGSWLWRRREQLAARAGTEPKGVEGRSSILLGATITAVELPTAFPYFAVIATVVTDVRNPFSQILLLLLFNLCFILPLGGIIVTLWVAGERATEVLGRVREYLRRRGPFLLATAALIAGTFSIVLGATGIAAQSHSRAGILIKRIRHLIPGG